MSSVRYPSCCVRNEWEVSSYFRRPVSLRLLSELTTLLVPHQRLGEATIERTRLHPAVSTRQAGLQKDGASQRAKRAIAEAGCMRNDWS